MRICFFDFNLNFGGAAQGSLFLLSRLKAEGFDVAVIDAYGKNAEYQNKADEYGLSFKVLTPKAKNTFIGYHGYKRFLHALAQAPSFVRLLYRLMTSLKEMKPNIVIVNNDKSLFFVSLLKKLIGFKILLYYRGEATLDQLKPGFVKRINKNTDAIITHSKKAYENLKPFIQKQNNKLYFTHNCIDFRDIENIVKNNDFPSSKNFTLLLAAGRPVKEKGHDIAIKAIGSLKKEGIIVNLLIPGSIPVGHSDHYYLYLKQLIKDLALSEQVKFIGWRSNFMGDLIQADAILLPSHTEGFPRSIIEAMLLGIPVCATPVGGIPEAIIHNKTGLLFDIGNVKQLSACIRALIEDNELRIKIINNARNFSKDYFNPRVNTNEISNLLVQIVGKKPNQ